MTVVLSLLVALCSGILVSWYFHLSVSLYFLIGSTVLPLGISIHQRWKAEIFPRVSAFAFAVVLFLLGAYLEKNRAGQNLPNHISNVAFENSSQNVQLRISNYPVPANNWIKFQAEITGIDSKPMSGKILLYLEADSLSKELNYGDEILAIGKISEIPPPANPNAFDYKNYLNHQGITHQLFLRSEQWTHYDNSANPILKIIFNTRKNCSEIIDESSCSDEAKAISKALLLGDPAWISDELMLTYAASGTLHVLAVSGLHVGIIMLILNFLLSPLKRLPKGKLVFLLTALTGIWFYALLTGFTPSILRASVMFSFMLIGKEMQRDTSIYQSLWVSAFVLIIIDPHVIFQLGFLLSYLAVFGIVFFHPLIYAKLQFQNKLIDKAWQLISVSTAAQLATLPLSIYCFHQFPSYFLIANLVVIPISFIALLAGLAALILSAVPWVSDFLFYILDKSIWLMNEGVKIIEQTPGAIIQNLVISWFDVVLLYGILFSFTYALLKKSKKLLICAFTICTVFCVSLIYQQTVRWQKNSLVFYSMSDEVTVDYIHQNSVFTIVTNTDNNTKSKQFSVLPNRLFSTGQVKAEVIHQLDSSHCLFQFHDKKILFANQYWLDANTLFPEVNCLYLYQVDFIPKQLIEHLLKKDIPVMLGYDVAYKSKEYLKNQLHSAYVFDLKSEGAITIDLCHQRR